MERQFDLAQHMVNTFVPSLYNPDLPGNLIIHTLGMDYFERLQTQLGGTTIKPPRDPARLDEQHHLVKALGHEDARRLCEVMGGEEFYVPRGKRHASPHLTATARLLRAGKTCTQIARELGISDRHVRNLRGQASRLMEPPTTAQ